MTRPDLRSARAIAQERQDATRASLVMCAWFALVSLAVAYAVAPIVIAKAQHDAIEARRMMEGY